MMPVMGGEEALEAIRAIRPDVPVIGSSGYSESVAKERFGGKGLAAFLQKPYSARILADRVKQVLEQDRAPIRAAPPGVGAGVNSKIRETALNAGTRPALQSVRMRRLLTLLLLLISAAAWAQKAKPARDSAARRPRRRARPAEGPAGDGFRLHGGRADAQHRPDRHAHPHPVSSCLRSRRSLDDPAKRRCGPLDHRASQTGDYGVTVLRTNSSAPVSTFKLRVTIH